MKILVVYYSLYGHVFKLAQAVRIAKLWLALLLCHIMDLSSLVLDSRLLVHQAFGTPKSSNGPP